MSHFILCWFPSCHFMFVYKEQFKVPNYYFLSLSLLFLLYMSHPAYAFIVLHFLSFYKNMFLFCHSDFNVNKTSFFFCHIIHPLWVWPHFSCFISPLRAVSTEPLRSHRPKFPIWKQDREPQYVPIFKNYQHLLISSIIIKIKTTLWV